MCFSPRPVRILVLATSLMTAACGGGGGAPAAPSETHAFLGEWRGRYVAFGIKVMPRCASQSDPVLFIPRPASGILDVTVEISGDVEGRMRFVSGDDTVTCPFAGERNPVTQVLSATVNGASCTPPNARVPAGEYVLGVSPTPPGCRGRDDLEGPKPWPEMRELNIEATVDTAARDYPILTLLVDEEGQFHDPQGYYTGTYIVEGSGQLTHPDDPLVGG